MVKVDKDRWAFAFGSDCDRARTDKFFYLQIWRYYWSFTRKI